MALISKDDVGNVHLLNDSWKLWYWRFSGTVVPDVNWTDNLHGLCEFDSVEKFWRQVLTNKRRAHIYHFYSIFHHIKMPSMLTIGCDYSVFKSDIKPMWEDPSNKNGGRWLIKDNGLLDQYWMDILLSMIGGMYDPYNDNICGIVYNRRQYSKISVWISSSDSNIVNDIGSKLKHFLGTKEKLKFEKHSESLKKKNSLHKKNYFGQMTQTNI